MNDILLMNIKQRLDFEDNERKEKAAIIKKILKYLKINNMQYWIKRIDNNRTISGKYDVAKMIKWV